MYVWKLNSEPVPPLRETSTAAGSAHPLIVTDGSGHSNTSPRARHTSSQKLEGSFPTELRGMKSLQKNPNTSPRLFSQSVIERRNMVADWKTFSVTGCERRQPSSSSSPSGALRGFHQHRLLRVGKKKCNHSTDVQNWSYKVFFHMTTLISSFIKHS